MLPTSPESNSKNMRSLLLALRRIKLQTWYLLGLLLIGWDHRPKWLLRILYRLGLLNRWRGAANLKFNLNKVWRSKVKVKLKSLRNPKFRRWTLQKRRRPSSFVKGKWKAVWLKLLKGPVKWRQIIQFKKSTDQFNWNL